MTDKPALMEGYYVDAKFMRGIKVLRVSIDLPIEYSNEFLRMFGAPTAAEPVRVVVARLQDGAYAPEGNGPVRSDSGQMHNNPHAEKAEGQDKPRTLTRSQKAALMCKDPQFQKWIIGKYDMLGLGVTDARANEVIKRVLAVHSKSTLDTDPEKAAAFDKLRVDFEVRDLVR